MPIAWSVGDGVPEGRRSFLGWLSSRWPKAYLPSRHLPRIARALVQLKGTKTAEGRLAEGHYLTPNDRREAMAALSAVGGADLAACVGCAGVSNQATRMLTRMFQVHGARPPCRALTRAWHVHRAPLSFW